MSQPRVAVGAIVIRDDALLLVQRGKSPGLGQWSVPGGIVEAGETVRAALVREVLEETGIVVEIGEFAGWVERILDDFHDGVTAIRRNTGAFVDARLQESALDRADTAMQEYGFAVCGARKGQ